MNLFVVKLSLIDVFFVYLTNRDTILSTKEPHLPLQTLHTEEKTDATELNTDEE